MDKPDSSNQMTLYIHSCHIVLYFWNSLQASYLTLRLLTVSKLQYNMAILKERMRWANMLSNLFTYQNQLQVEVVHCSKSLKRKHAKPILHHPLPFYLIYLCQHYIQSWTKHKLFITIMYIKKGCFIKLY